MYFDFNNSKGEVRQHLLEYLRLINADEKKHDKDVEMIITIAVDNGMSGTELKALIMDIDAGKVTKPNNPKEIFDQIFYLINLSLHDDYFNNTEFDFCVDMAELYGVESNIAPKMVREIYNCIKLEMKEDDIVKELISKSIYPIS